MLVPRLCLGLALAAASLALGGGCATGGTETDGVDVDAAHPSGIDAGFDGGGGPLLEDGGGDGDIPPSDGGSSGDGGSSSGGVRPSARSLAAGATVSTSPKYRAVRTLGQSPGGNGAASSSNFKMKGGLVGATQ